MYVNVLTYIDVYYVLCAECYDQYWYSLWIIKRGKRKKKKAR